MSGGHAGEGSARAHPCGVCARRLEADEANLAHSSLRALEGDRGRSPADEGHLRRFLDRAGNIFILASRGDQAVGFLVAYVLERLDGDRPMVCLYEILVAQGHRGRGVGRTMVDAMLGVCRGIDAGKVWTVTNRSNVPASALCRRTGADAPAGDDIVYVWERREVGREG